MKPSRFSSTVVAVAALLLAAPSNALACAACFGRSDDRMAIGMNYGVFVLLAVILGVLIGVAGFFIFLARRAAYLRAVSQPETVSELVTKE